MIDALFLLASEAAHEESSKTFFYAAGGALAVWAVLLSVVGLSKADWPETGGPAKAVMAITAVLVGATMAATIVTA